MNMLKNCVVLLFVALYLITLKKCTRPGEQNRISGRTVNTLSNHS